MPQRDAAAWVQTVQPLAVQLGTKQNMMFGDVIGSAASTVTPWHVRNDALTYGALSNYLQQRQQVLEQLRAHRIFTVDETAQNLAVALANQYLDVKAGGLL